VHSARHEPYKAAPKTAAPTATAPMAIMSAKGLTVKAAALALVEVEAPLEVVEEGDEPVEVLLEAVPKTPPAATAGAEERVVFLAAAA